MGGTRFDRGVALFVDRLDLQREKREVRQSGDGCGGQQRLHLCGEPFVPDRPVPTERLFVCDHHRRTGWQSSSLLQCEAAEVAGDKLFIRDKQKIKVVQISDCTPENRFKVPVFAQNTDSTSSNNGFNLESVARHEGLIYVSDYETSRILVIGSRHRGGQGRAGTLFALLPYAEQTAQYGILSERNVCCLRK